MGKLKTRKTLARRVRITKNGKIMHKQTRTGHLKVKMDSSRKSRTSGVSVTDKAHTRLFKRWLGK